MAVLTPSTTVLGSSPLAQEQFLNALHLEQRRTERSRRGFVLMLLEPEQGLSAAIKKQTFEKLLVILSGLTRETDVIGWYRDRFVLGIIFTETTTGHSGATVTLLRNRISSALSASLGNEQANQIRISAHLFPEEADEPEGSGPENPALSADPAARAANKKASGFLKRGMDLLGSSIALVLLSPALILIAIAVKLTSSGPILFRQKRVGQYGRYFTFLKFRSMYTACNHAIHEEYVKSLIAEGSNRGEGSARQNVVYKLTKDPRVTPLGRFLRRTSLDELPQFFNVLIGDMSLVGPRPPIPYEVKHYDIWHKRRLWAVKPGITGLWQVKGRSRVKFDDMVRLDLEYAKSWSIWLDIKIVLQTPRAIVSGDGAY